MKEKTKKFIKEMDQAISAFKTQKAYNKFKVLLVSTRMYSANSFTLNSDMFNLEVSIKAYTSLEREEEHVIYNKEETFTETNINQIDVFVELTEHYANLSNSKFRLEIPPLTAYFIHNDTYSSQLERLNKTVDILKDYDWIAGGIIGRTFIIL